MSYPVIRIADLEYILIGEDEGAITTPDRYRLGLVSYAHLMPWGTIMRYNEEIGTRADITFTGERVDVEPSEEAWASNFGDPRAGWKA